MTHFPKLALAWLSALLVKIDPNILAKLAVLPQVPLQVVPWLANLAKLLGDTGALGYVTRRAKRALERYADRILWGSDRDDI